MLRALDRSSFLLLLALSASAEAGQIELLSQVHPRSLSDSGMGASEARSISADGRYLAFLSEASNLVPGQIDRNVGADVFVYDRVTGTTELVSRSAESATATGLYSSADPSISRDGRYVVFTSQADDLAAGQGEDDFEDDVYLYDRVTRTTELVSHTMAGYSQQPAISGDGRYVVFTNSGNLFLYDRSSRRNALIQRGHSPAISADGRFIAFLSTAEGPRWEVLLYDRTSRKTTLITRATSSTSANAPHSRRPVISADGSSVVFDSSAARVIPNQTGPAGRTNLFLFHRPTGRTSLVSHTSSSPTTAGDGNTGSFAVSADGSFVAFTSVAKNHVDRQTEGRRVLDAFLYSRANGRITLVSGVGGSSTVTANGASSVRGISADGNLILFQSSATNLVQGAVDGNGASDVFLYDRRSRKTSLVSHGAASPSRTGNGESLGSILSADGKWVAFQSAATDLVSGAKDLNERVDVFLDGRAAGREMASRRAPDLPSATAQGWSWVESMSADGRFVVFSSSARWLVAGQRDTNGRSDVFLRDRALGTTVLVSRSAVSPNTTGNAASYIARISADGRFVAFLSLATDLLPGPAATPDEDEAALFLYGRETGSLVRIAGDVAPFAGVALPAISADGSFVAFVSMATDLVAGQTDGNGKEDVFLYDRAAGTTTLVSRVPGSAATAGNAYSTSPSLSADGRFIAFESHATNLVAGQIDPDDLATAPTDIFLHDRVAGTTTLVSRTASSPKTASHGEGPIVSADGRFVAFRSVGTEVVPGQVEADGEYSFTYDVFLYDRLTGVNTLVSHAPDSPLTAVGATGPGDQYVESWMDLDLSADGRFVVFASFSDALTGLDQDEEGPDFLHQDVFLFDRETGAVTGVSEQIATRAYEPRISADGRFIAFTGDEFVGYWANPIFDGNIYLYDRVTGSVIPASDSYSHSNASPSSCPGPSHFRYRYSGNPILSATGHVLLFATTACELVPRDLNGGPSDDPAFGDYMSDGDVFVYTHP